IIGEAAVYVDPENIEQMADAIHSVLRHDDIRSQLRENAQQELRRYSWERLARQTIAVYDRFR
ncbi:MAG TPA: glycosyltransferase family 1 protein, partial [Candidatus Kapabacteria bacterium]|nr:glycosyltransferase family 1 protein [Candidatus Kapabacteria bacterium]